MTTIKTMLALDDLVTGIFACNGKILSFVAMTHAGFLYLQGGTVMLSGGRFTN